MKNKNTTVLYLPDPLIIEMEITEETETFYHGDLVYFKATGYNSGYFTKKVIEGQTPSVVMAPPTENHRFIRVRWGNTGYTKSYNPDQLEFDFGPRHD